jgi:hypothetical protein
MGHTGRPGVKWQRQAAQHASGFCDPGKSLPWDQMGPAWQGSERLYTKCLVWSIYFSSLFILLDTFTHESYDLAKVIYRSHP